MNSGSALLETFSCVYSKYMLNIVSFFQTLIKRGAGIIGRLNNFSKIDMRVRQLFDTREY